MNWFRRILVALLAILRPTMAGAEETPLAEPRTMMAMVALRDTVFPQAKELSDYLNEHWPTLGPFTPEMGEEGVPAVASPDGIMLAALTIDMPIPESDWQFACQTTPIWENACQEFHEMQGHVVVAHLSKNDIPLAKQTLLVSAFTQAVSARTNAIGVYLGQASAVWSSRQWADEVIPASLEKPPYLLWMGLKTQVGNDGGKTVATMGMPIFGMKNIEVQNSMKDGLELVNLVTSTAYYLLENGAVISEGDTIGFTADQKVKIDFAPSAFDPAITVYRLQY